TRSEVMPQGKRKLKSAEEILGIQAPLKSAEEILGIQAPAPTPEQPPGPAPGFLENLGIGAQRTLLNIADAGRVMEEALGAATKGDFGPLKQIGELVGRRTIDIGNALAAGPYQAAPAYLASQAEQAPRIEQIHQEQQARMAKIPELYSQEAIAEHN